jgi:hypothetical protein
MTIISPIKNLNDEFYQFAGDGNGWYGFRADYVITAGVRSMTLKYQPLIGLLHRLIEIADQIKPQTTAVIEVEMKERYAHIKFNSCFGEDYEDETKEYDYILDYEIGETSVTFNLGIDNIFCLPCED